MENCPVCKATFRGKHTCHRCKSDLAPLISVEKRAAACLAAARTALANKDYAGAFALSRTSLGLKKSREARSMCVYTGLLAEKKISAAGR